MKQNVYAINDSKVGAFMTPFFSHSDATAVRQFRAAGAHKDSILSTNPADFSLYNIGIFCDESGTIEPLPVPKFVANLQQTED